MIYVKTVNSEKLTGLLGGVNSGASMKTAVDFFPSDRQDEPVGLMLEVGDRNKTMRLDESTSLFKPGGNVFRYAPEFTPSNKPEVARLFYQRVYREIMDTLNAGNKFPLTDK